MTAAESFGPRKPDPAMTTPTSTDLHVRVEGRVQGVGFRDTCVHQARKLGLVGWVRNRRDGTVEVMARGSAHALADLEAWLHRGPPLARVDRVTLIDSANDAPDAADTAETCGTTGFECRDTL